MNYKPLRPLAAALFVFLLLFAFPLAAEPEHGSLDVYSKDGLSLAWAILRAPRGTDPEKDLVLLRIKPKAGTSPLFKVRGVDPFSGEAKPLFSGAPKGIFQDVAIERAHFADYPRTEIVLYESREAFTAEKPARTIFFLGLPDTTPEFLDREKLETYLAKRIASD